MPGWLDKILKLLLFYFSWPKFLTPLSWPIFEKYLLVMERLHFWTGYVQSIVKATKERLGGHYKIEKHKYFYLLAKRFEHSSSLIYKK